VLGGEERARHIVDGTRWWQVRGVQGIDASWIVNGKDWKVANKRRKMSSHQKNGNVHEAGEDPLDNTEGDPQYSSELDPLRCMYYLHGGKFFGFFFIGRKYVSSAETAFVTQLIGGYFFGSLGQEEYCLRRYAR